MKKEIYERIIDKKELRELPKEDVERTFEKYKDDGVSNEEKIRRTRASLNKIFWPFRSHKLLGLKKRDKSIKWILRKHMSSRERLPYYSEVYERLFKDFKNFKDSKEKINIFDLGSGINGFSYTYFPYNLNISYLSIEAVGQLVRLMNYYFNKNNFDAKSIHRSLFDLDFIEKKIKKKKGKKIVFLFKVLDSLEMLEKDYSKKVLKKIVPLVDKIVISFATKSMIKKEDFKVNRKWILDFIKKNFQLLDDFEIGAERYVVFEGVSKKQNNL